MGFGGRKNTENENANLKKKYEDAVKDTFRPEFINRLDEMVVFNQLSKDDIFHIVTLEVEMVTKRAMEKNIKLILTNEAREFLFDKGFDPKFGARPLRRAVEKYIENPLSESIIRDTIKEGDNVEIVVTEAKDKLEFKTVPTIGKATVEPKKTRKKIAVKKEANE
jgi:ATP-dependent Clp protease ATP-binding subunit ClpC